MARKHLHVDKALLDSIDQAIKSGKFAWVKSQYKKMAFSKVDPTYIGKLAANAKRVGLVNEGLKLLRPLIYPLVKGAKKATDKDKIEYASLLMSLGVLSEANRLLGEINPNETPRVYRAKAFLHIYKWEYKEACTQLELYLKSTTDTGYPVAVAKLNLAGSYAAIGRRQDAFDLSQELLSSEIFSENLLVKSNLLELQGQLAIEDKDFDRALKILDQASQKLKKLDSKYLLYIKKWKAIAESNQSEKPTKEFIEIRSKAENLGSWNTVRDCDFRRALIEQDDQLFFKVYFGSPFLEYRDRILTQYKNGIVVPAGFLWRPGETKVKPRQVLDLKTGQLEPESKKLKKNQIILRIIQILASDFYQPFSVGRLFSALYPDEIYDPDNSKQKLHVNITRARKWLKSNNLDLEIIEINKSYRLTGKGSLALRCHLNIEVRPIEISLVDQLNSLYGNKPFKLSAAAKALDIPERSLSRLLKKSVVDGTIIKEGKGRGTIYMLVQTSLQQVA